jgi:hypothetical protein
MRARYPIRHPARVVDELEVELAHNVNVSEPVRAHNLGLATSSSLARLVGFSMQAGLEHL